MVSGTPWAQSVLCRLTSPCTEYELISFSTTASANQTAGLFAGELQLASEAPLGSWSIEITSSEEETIRKDFSVEEYGNKKFKKKFDKMKFLCGILNFVSSNIRGIFFCCSIAEIRCPAEGARLHHRPAGQLWDHSDGQVNKFDFTRGCVDY